MTNTKKYLSLLSKLIDPRFLKRLPSLIRFKLNRFLHEKLVFKLASKEDIFTSIWRNNYWGSGESLSGPGSTLEQTINLREKLPGMFAERGIKLVFDSPCGDMYWMQHVLKSADFIYIGGDIVEELVDINKKKFSNSKVSFVKFDITKDIFPTADVWLCRAVFFHLSNRDVYLALEQFAASNIKYLLTTNCVTNVGHINIDISTGDWRSLDLTLPPFNFPRQSMWEIEDCVSPHPPMTLTLWTKSQVESTLPAMRGHFKK